MNDLFELEQQPFHFQIVCPKIKRRVLCAGTMEELAEIADRFERGEDTFQVGSNVGCSPNYFGGCTGEMGSIALSKEHIKLLIETIRASCEEVVP